MVAERSLELSVPARAEYIAVVRLVVSSLAIARRALAEERIDDLKLAVSEACTNAFEANVSAGRADSPVTISCYEAPERFEVSVADAGPGFDPEQLPSHPPVTDPERLNFERGLGIPLIRSLVDDVRFESGTEGTVVTMTLFGGPEYGDETTEIVRIVIAEQE